MLQRPFVEPPVDPLERAERRCFFERLYCWWCWWRCLVQCLPRMSGPVAAVLPQQAEPEGKGSLRSCLSFQTNLGRMVPGMLLAIQSILAQPLQRLDYRAGPDAEGCLAAHLTLIEETHQRWRRTAPKVLVMVGAERLHQGYFSVEPLKS